MAFCSGISMQLPLTSLQLEKVGLTSEVADALLANINALLKNLTTTAEAWEAISHTLLAEYPFPVHLVLFKALYPDFLLHPEMAPAYVPSLIERETSNLYQLMQHQSISDLSTFHAFSTNHPSEYWEMMISQLKIVFDQPPTQICDLALGIEAPKWLPNARMNIVNSCFTAPSNAIAIRYMQGKNLVTLSYGELNHLVNRVANSLLKSGFNPGDAIGIAMPMNLFAVATYLGIIKMGGVVVSIADSFSTEEIALRLQLSHAKGIFTQDYSIWMGKKIPLYDKVKNTEIAKIIIIPCEDQVSSALRSNDVKWDEFLVADADFTSHAVSPQTPCNILFSSGTTGTPKAIVWDHTTAIKAASDAFLHQNIQANDILAWPTNLGWMMGPWLIYASFINRASIALYTEAPKDRAFGEFIQNAGVTVLGVVPTLVGAWRQSQCMEKLDWSTIKIFTSTGESSNWEDMLYLMSLAHYKPIIEYCGGTEIGGAYLSSTVMQDNCPSLFSTKVMGIDLVILDEEGNESDKGEVALLPPSIGLSTRLLNADHHEVYFENMPTYHGKLLRRHGDQIKQYANGYFSILGRVDDTMNLGGIKTSSAEIERSLAGISGIQEVAAVAIQPAGNGPSQLVIFAATKEKLAQQTVLKEMQKRINTHLNPLFKIHDIVFMTDLPKTASNKIMRRVLRKKYQEQ